MESRMQLSCKSILCGRIKGSDRSRAGPIEISGLVNMAFDKEIQLIGGC
jgi:hypothetical protein